MISSGFEYLEPQEPLFFLPMDTNTGPRIFSPAYSLDRRTKSPRADGLWKNEDNLREITGIKSSQFLQKVLGEIMSVVQGGA